MKRHILLCGASLLAVAMCAGCGPSPERTPPGATPAPAANPAPRPAPVPTVPSFPEVVAPSGEWQNKVEDVRHDVDAIVARRAGSTRDFADDLRGLIETSDKAVKPATINGLAAQMSRSMPVAKGGTELHSQLATLLYVATRKVPLSEDRMMTLGSQTESLLTGSGVPPAQAKAVGQLVVQLARETRGA